MGKIDFKPGNMLYPLPVVMVSVTDGQGHDNILTVAWTGTVCSDPPMLSVSVRPERYSYPLLKDTGEFVVNLVTEELVFATDYCGVKSGRDVDKFREMKLTKLSGTQVKAPLIGESPVNLECRVKQVIPLGTQLKNLPNLTFYVDRAVLYDRRVHLHSFSFYKSRLPELIHVFSRPDAA